MAEYTIGDDDCDEDDGAGGVTEWDFEEIEVLTDVTVGCADGELTSNKTFETIKVLVKQ